MRRKNKKIDMLNGSIWDKMIVFALPLAFTGMLQQLFNAADVAVLGRFVSNESMAGVGNNVPVIGLIKREYPGYTGRITMTMREVDECMEALSDIISIDCTVLLDGYQADMARTFPGGEISPEAQALIDAAKESFGKGLAFARKGYRIGDISHAIQTSVEGHGYGVVRSLCGHGIGKEMHEDPEVPNFGKPGHGLRLREGLCIAVEPMITAGDYRVYIAEDNWAFLTRDHSLSAHYENTLAITESGEALILTMPDGFDGEDV